MGVLLSVEDEDFPDAIIMAKRCYDLGIQLYATKDTARAISSVGIHVQTVADPKISDEIITMMETCGLPRQKIVVSLLHFILWKMGNNFLLLLLGQETFLKSAFGYWKTISL